MLPPDPSERPAGRIALWLAGASAVSVVFSIAVCQILLALALAALLVSGLKLRFPPLGTPLALFMLGTLISMLLSADPAAGRPQLRKFFVFFVLLVLCSAFTKLAQIKFLVLAWAAAGTLSAVKGLIQFAQKYQEAAFAGRNFYEYYVVERITGFMSHWMTFSGQLLVILLMLAAFILFSPSARSWRLWAGLACAVLMAAAIVLGFTRSIWLAAGVASVYLIARWRRRLLWLLPVVIALGIILAPGAVRTRLVSLFEPQQEIDSNQHRIVCWRTGWQMIKAHPWFGLGPEQVRIQFDHYVPPDIPRPLPGGWYGHLHSIYVHYAAERGTPTALALVWLLLKILLDFLSALKKLPPGPGEARFILQGATAVVIAIMVEGFFELNLGDSEVLTLVLAVVAAGYVAREHVASGGGAASAELTST